MSGQVVSIDGIHVHGDQISQALPILTDVSGTFLPSQISAIVGPSGSGKTTLLTVLGGLRRPDRGTISIGKNSVYAMSEIELDRFRLLEVGFIFQSFRLIDELDALRNISFPLELNGVPRIEARDRSLFLLERLRVAHRRHARPRDLSGGEKQRVAIARALVGNPSLILADEPTASLDKQSAIDVAEVLVACAHQFGQTVILVTHDTAIAEMADARVTIENGLLSIMN